MGMTFQERYDEWDEIDEDREICAKSDEEIENDLFNRDMADYCNNLHIGGY